MALSQCFQDAVAARRRRDGLSSSFQAYAQERQRKQGDGVGALAEAGLVLDARRPRGCTLLGRATCGTGSDDPAGTACATSDLLPL